MRTLRYAYAERLRMGLFIHCHTCSDGVGQRCKRTRAIDFPLIPMLKLNLFTSEVRLPRPAAACPIDVLQDESLSLVSSPDSSVQSGDSERSRANRSSSCRSSRAEAWRWRRKIAAACICSPSGVPRPVYCPPRCRPWVRIPLPSWYPAYPAK